MAKITICGDAMVVTSTKTLEDIKTLEKYRPKALALYSEDGKEEVFRVGSSNGKGSISTYGASFGSVSHDDNKFATITMDIPAGTTDAEAYAEEVIGVAIINLNKVEAQFEAALEEVKAEKAEVRSNITVA